MKKLKYENDRISPRDIFVAIPSIVTGVGVLSLPKVIASATESADGWIPLFIGGLIAIGLTWAVAKFASGFRHQSFLTYATKIVTKPVAMLLTSLFAVIFLMITSYQVRKISNIAQQYLFDQTPIEIIALSFLLVVIYAVSGSRVGLFRLNIMFLPIILLIAFFLIIFNLGWFEPGRLLPIFITPFTDYVKVLNQGVLAYMGFGVLWFYLALVDQPDKAPKMAALGMCIPVGLYIIIFFVCIAVFGNAVTSNLLYPTVELAKVVEIPGGFFERFESIFFVIWIMAIFNTTAMALDVSVFALNSIFKNTMKLKLIFMLAPVAYIMAMLPQDVIAVDFLGGLIGNVLIILNLVVLILLPVVAKIRGVKQSE
ncbi:GerAB/ArcD/ProY family transporter [Gracilibacillus phocaeensis]|uniref:GerAB/ArcD/ProY family transporter n=1 Tax=Gracilibacillus phocaeensis TaxID=2042304 RepID=UPI00102FD194|nr:endospore germination permease [Gracilibacillus phocaeensis]